MENSISEMTVKKCIHHDRAELCTSRPPYRQGRKLTAVKVYTVNEESQHLLIRGVPDLQLQKELKNLCSRYGDVKFVNLVSNYAEDEEPFTKVYHVFYEKIQSARFSKHMLDDRSFYGGVLHVCYAPELETLAQTKNKLIQRKREVFRRIKQSQPNQMISGNADGEDIITGLTFSCTYTQKNNNKSPGQFTKAAGVIKQRFIPHKPISLLTYNSDILCSGQHSTSSKIESTPCVISPHYSDSIVYNVNNSQNCNVNTLDTTDQNTVVPNISTDVTTTKSVCSLKHGSGVTQASLRRKPIPDKFIPTSVKRIKFNKNS